MKLMQKHIKDIVIAVIIFFTANVVFGVEALASTPAIESDTEAFVPRSSSDNLQLRIEPISQVELPIEHTVEFFSDQVNVSLCVVTMYKPNLRVEVADSSTNMRVITDSDFFPNQNAGHINAPKHFDPVCEENGNSSFTLQRNMDETDSILDMVTLVISPE